jgi:phage FluMu protein Com
MSLKVDSSLICPHCIEVFTEPKILPACGHSLCKECIEDLMVFNILQRNNQSFKEHTSLTIYPGVSNVATDSNKYIQIKCPKCDKANFIHENAKIEDSLETDEELQKKCEQWKQSSMLKFVVLTI